MNTAQEIAGVDITGLTEVDPEFSQLQKTCSPVAVYRYDASSHSWQYTDVIGSLYLYIRNSQQRYGMMVKSERNFYNFLQKFDSSAVFVMHQPYLLVRAGTNSPKDYISAQETIHCIWFYEPADCLASANTLRSMGLKYEGERKPTDEATEEKSQAPINDHSLSNLENHLYHILRTATKQPIDVNGLLGESESKV